MASRQHPILPLAMLLAGVSPLINNSYDVSVQLACFFTAGAAGILARLQYRRAFSRSHEYPAGSFVPVLVGLLFLTWLVVSLSWSVDKDSTVNEILRVAFYLVLFLLVLLTFGRREVEKIYFIIIFTGIMVALVGILEYLFLKAGRIHSTFINPNPLGIYLAMVLILGIGRYWQAGGRLLAAGLVITGTALILTSSRGSLLALGIGLLLSLWLTGRKQLAVMLKSTAVILAASALLAKLVMYLSPRLQNFTTASSLLKSIIRAESFLSSSVEGRVTFWKAAWNMFLERPLTGFGPGSYHDVYFSFYEGGRWYSLYAHNHYLQVLAETGLAGLVIFLVFIIFLIVPIIYIRKAKICDYYLAAAYGAMIAFLFHIGMDFTWDMPAVTLLFFIIAGCSRVIWARYAQGKRGNKYLQIKWLRAVSGALSILLLLGSVIIGSALYCARQGDMFAGGGNYKDALKYWHEAARLTPWNDAYHARLGGVLAACSTDSPYFKIAGQELRHAVRLSPYDYRHVNKLAFYEQKAGNQEEAGKLFRRAVELGGYVPSLYFDLGNFYITAGQEKLAVEIWRKGLEQCGHALESAPEVYKGDLLQVLRGLHINLANYYAKHDMTDMAARHLYQVLVEYPQDP